MSRLMDRPSYKSLKGKSELYISWAEDSWMQKWDIWRWKDSVCAYLSHAQSWGLTYWLSNAPWCAKIVTELPKLTPYYRINHSFWSLRNNTELTCRLCQVKPGKSLITKDRKPYIKTHTKVSTEINKSQFYYINSHKGLFNCKLSLFNKSKLFRVYKYSGIKLNEKR
jgi:hypothetical protein